ncbi:hypothetical protein, partial [Streptomyces cyaneofuscatus]|uniref:hypothetical protein n=1 Tax=Streptomyces cyaneofuscatus TaxID=66883 RepID=UPI002FF06AB2
DLQYFIKCRSNTRKMRGSIRHKSRSTLLLWHNAGFTLGVQMSPLVVGVFVGIVLFFLGKRRAAGLVVLASFVIFLLYQLTLST